MPSASTTITPPDAIATTPGRRPVNLPSRWNTPLFGVRCHDFDGQNTLVPSRDTTAGTSVTAASAISTTAIDRPGPKLVNAPNTASSNAMNAITMAAAADAMTSP